MSPARPGATAAAAETGTMPCQASYIAGRTRSFIAASSTTKRVPAVCFCRDNGREQHAGRADQPAARLQRHADIEVVERGALIAPARPRGRAPARCGRECRGRRRNPRTRTVWPCVAQRADQVGDAGDRRRGYGARSRIWLPIWVARPTGSMPGQARGLGHTARRRRPRGCRICRRPGRWRSWRASRHPHPD